MGAVDSEPVWIGRVEVCANSIRVVLNVVVEDGQHLVVLGRAVDSGRLKRRLWAVPTWAPTLAKITPYLAIFVSKSGHFRIK